MSDPDPRAWTTFDPNLRIDVNTIEGGNIVVITHLPSGMQEACGTTTSVVRNRATAMVRLRHRVG
jgi:protein subunit release factor A